MELTAPWKDMKLSIDGGLVVNSTADNLLVRFPATPATAFKGLAATLQDELVAQGWSVGDTRSLEDEFTAIMRTADGKKSNFVVDVHNGRPDLSISILEP